MKYKMKKKKLKLPKYNTKGILKKKKKYSNYKLQYKELI